MELYLFYQGSISTTGHTKQKFKYRRTFLDQLKELHAHHKEEDVPLDMTFSPDKLRLVGEFRFLPLVTKACRKIVDLEITLLSHCEPACIKQYPTGDLDNLLKALIDGLRMAQNKNEIRSERPGENESPFYCLLEDDQIIRNINISHNKLYFSSQSKDNKQSEIFALIKVSIRPKFAYK